MNEGFADAAVERLRAALRTAMGGLAIASEARIKDAIAVPVEYVGADVIRSDPGEPPRKETGRLQAAVASAVEEGPDSITALSGYLGQEPPYAAALEYGTGRMSARPHVGPERDRLRDEAVDEIRHSMPFRL